MEEDTSRSLAATLKLAKMKGYVDREAKRQPSTAISSAKKAKIEAKAYTIEEKRGDERRDHRTRGREQLREVRESEDYKPEINLVYTDDTGRELTAKKAAYNYMCYKFHGKGPSKNKIDKRLRKQELERRMTQALSATDVPSSATLMISKQKELQTPYIVLTKGK